MSFVFRCALGTRTLRSFAAKEYKKKQKTKPAKRARRFPFSLCETAVVQTAEGNSTEFALSELHESLRAHKSDAFLRNVMHAVRVMQALPVMHAFGACGDVHAVTQIRKTRHSSATKSGSESLSDHLRYDSEGHPYGWCFYFCRALGTRTLRSFAVKEYKKKQKTKPAKRARRFPFSR